MAEEWFMLWFLYCLPLLFKDWQKSGSCCCCYIVNYYCLRFDRREVHVVVVILSTFTVCGLIEDWFMLWLSYFLPLLFKVWQKGGSCCFCHIVYLYCLMFDRGVVHVVGDYIFYNYHLRFDRGVAHVVVILFIITI